MQGKQELTHEARAEGKFIYTMPCKKEESKDKPDAQHTLAYVSNRAIEV